MKHGYAKLTAGGLAGTIGTGLLYLIGEIAGTPVTGAIDALAALAFTLLGFYVKSERGYISKRGEF